MRIDLLAVALKVGEAAPGRLLRALCTSLRKLRHTYTAACAQPPSHNLTFNAGRLVLCDLAALPIWLASRPRRNLTFSVGRLTMSRLEAPISWLASRLSQAFSVHIGLIVPMRSINAGS